MVSCGPSHCLAVLEDGSVSGWGHNGWGRSTSRWPLQLGGRASAVAAGGEHSLALLDSGRVVGWGHNLQRQTSVPDVVNSVGAETIAAGSAFSAAVLRNGTLITWGSTNVQGITLSLGNQRVKAIAAGALHLVALTEGGVVVASGRNMYGEASVPKELTGQRIVAVAAGLHRSIAVGRDGTIHAWGARSYGAHAPPSRDSYAANAIAAACGARHALALLDNGVVLAWGDDDLGQCTLPDFAGMLPAKPIALAAGDHHSIALMSSGQVVCWGDNVHGQINPPDFCSLRALPPVSLALRDLHTRCLRVFFLWQERLHNAAYRLEKGKSGTLTRMLPRDLTIHIARFIVPHIVLCPTHTPPVAQHHATGERCCVM